jgi:hypothetical protein
LVHGVRIDKYIEDSEGFIYMKGNDIAIRIVGLNKVRIIKDTSGDARKILEDKGVEIE